MQNRIFSSKRNLVFSIFIIVLLNFKFITAQSRSLHRIAVLDFETSSIFYQDAYQITAVFRDYLDRFEEISVMDPLQMEAILIDADLTLYNCFTVECAAEIGAALGVKTVIIGGITITSQTSSIYLNLIDVTEKTVLHTIQRTFSRQWSSSGNELRQISNQVYYFLFPEDPPDNRPERINRFASNRFRRHKTFSIGMKFGVNSSSLQNNFDTNSQLGLIGGIYFNFSVSKELSFQTEILYSQKGSSFVLGYVRQSTYNRIYQTLQFQNDYLEVPLVLKTDISPEFGDMNSHLMAGVQFSRVIHTKAYYKFGNYSEPIDIAATDREDVGFLIGAGFSMDPGIGLITLEVRYAWGFRKVLENFQAGDSQITAKNRALSMLLEVGF